MRAGALKVARDASGSAQALLDDEKTPHLQKPREIFQTDSVRFHLDQGSPGFLEGLRIRGTGKPGQVFCQPENLSVEFE